MEDREIISLLESRDERAIDEIRAKYSAYIFTEVRDGSFNVIRPLHIVQPIL